MFKFIMRNLLRNKIRTTLAVAGIAVCVFIFASIQALDFGVQQMIKETGSENILIVFEKYKACPPYSKLPVHYAENISEIENVNEVMPVRFLLSNCGTTTDVVVIHGIEKDKIRKMRDFNIDVKQYDNFMKEKGSAIIGRSIAEKYSWKIGQQITLPQLRNISFNIKGIFSSPGSSLEEVIMVDRIYLEESISEIGVATMFMVQVDDKKNLDLVAATIDSKFDNSETATRSGPERSFITDQIESFRELVDFSQLIAYMALLLLLAAVANSVSMSVRDRLREIAIMKLIGFESDHICKLLLTESAILGFFASFLGVFSAWFVIHVNKFSISVEGFTMYPKISGMIILSSFVTGVLLNIIGAYLAVRKAVAKPVVESLRSID